MIVLDLAADDGIRVTTRLYEHLTAEPLSTPDGAIPVAVSMGVATWSVGEAIETVLGRADSALYTAKQLGGSRLETSEGATEPISGD